MKNVDLDTILKSYNKEIEKDRIDIELKKEEFAKKIKNGLGDVLNDVNYYVKKEPTFAQKLKTKIFKFFRYL